MLINLRYFTSSTNWNLLSFHIYYIIRKLAHSEIKECKCPLTWNKRANTTSTSKHICKLFHYYRKHVNIMEIRLSNTLNNKRTVGDNKRHYYQYSLFKWLQYRYWQFISKLLKLSLCVCVRDEH